MSKDPKYRRAKEKGRPDRAFVELGGRRIYLGRYDSDESREEFHRVLAEWRANGCRLPVPAEDLTIVELAAQFWTHGTTVSPTAPSAARRTTTGSRCSR